MTTAQLSAALGATAGVSVDREHAPSEPGWLGITTILKMAGLVDYSRVHPADLERAARRGNAVHLLTELEDAGDQEEIHRQLAGMDADIDPAGFLAGYMQFRSDTQWTLCGVEVLVHHKRLRVRGRVDRHFWIPGRGLAVVDVKPPHPDKAAIDCAKLQTAAYALATADELDLDLKDAMRIARHALCLREDGTYRLLPEFTDTIDFADFTSAARVAHRIVRRGK